jgi:preprotein translocase subunit YajC
MNIIIACILGVLVLTGVVWFIWRANRHRFKKPGKYTGKIGKYWFTVDKVK